MINLCASDVTELLEKNDHEVFHSHDGKDFNLNIVGLRSAESRPNYFDDTIAVVYKSKGVWISECFAATTLPGTPFLLKPDNQHGTAILAPGQYRSAYKLGLHKGKYEALVQVKPVKVYRDNNGDIVYDIIEDTSERGMFGINIHRAGLVAQVVGVNSAGCQVIQHRADYDRFITLCRVARAVWGEMFTYTLVDL